MRRELQWLIGIVLGGFLLYWGRPLFVPLSFALLVSFILYPISHWFELRKWSRTLSITFSMLILFLLASVVAFILMAQLSQFKQQWPAIQAKFSATFDTFSAYLINEFHIPAETQKQWVSRMVENGLEFAGASIVDSAIGVVMIILIPVYVALILYHRSMLVKALLHSFPPARHATIMSVIHQTIHTYYGFIKGMLVVYVIVGILNSLGLLMLGVPQAFLFGFIASILTFVPYVGIIVGAILPMGIAWLTHDSAWYAVGVAGIFTVVQYLEANLIFPMAVSQRLNINTLATLVAMFVGGVIWGGAGMILFIPFAAIIKLIADQTGEMPVLATLLGMSQTNGKGK